MSNSSEEERWAVEIQSEYSQGGIVVSPRREVSLNQYAWAVVSKGGSPRGFPGLRGEEPVYAYRPGQSFRPKIAEARTITLDMYVNGLDPDLDTQTDDTELQFNKNWDALQRLFWTPEKQIKLVRYWRVSENGNIYTKRATALAQISGVMDPTFTAPYRATFSVELLLSDPYFYGDPVSVPLNKKQPTVITNHGNSATTGFGCTMTFNWMTSLFLGDGDGNAVIWRVTNRYYLDGQPRPDIYPDNWFQGVGGGLPAEGSGKIYFDKSMVLTDNAAGPPYLSFKKGFADEDINKNNSNWEDQYYNYDYVIANDHGLRVNDSLIMGTVVGVVNRRVKSGGTYYVAKVFDSDHIGLSSEPGGAPMRWLNTGEPQYSAGYTYSPKVGAYPIGGATQNYGAPLWLVLYPGDNIVSVTSSYGELATGDVANKGIPVLTYREPYV